MPQQLSSLSYQPSYTLPLSSRSTSSLSNRRSTVTDAIPSSTSTYSSHITYNNNNNNNRSVNSTSTSQSDDVQRVNSSQSKRYSIDSTNGSNKSSTNSTKISNHFVIIPKSKSNQSLDKNHHHSSCPVSYQNQISLGTITILSDSSSDNTILHHLPDHNETTDKSQQSLHDERLHRSPRKPTNTHVIGSRLHSTSSIDETKKGQTPSLHYTIEPIEINDALNDENQHDSKQKAIREEKKRKANENEQVLINVDEYAPEILTYLKEREVRVHFSSSSIISTSSSFSTHHDPKQITCVNKRN